MIIFFASMAHQFSEHASQAVSRESGATLIPPEMRATLAQPLSQNAGKPARIFTGTDNALRKRKDGIYRVRDPQTQKKKR